MTELHDDKDKKIKELLSQLNENQREAVEYCNGASLVVAGAGSGKTRVLTYKIAYLILYGVLPYRILALTFTNKAAREMKNRIGTLVDYDKANQLYMGTFHSVFSRILRAEAQHIGYNSNFTIYDENDSRSLLKSIIKTLGLDDKKYKPATVHNIISMAKNMLITADAYANDKAACDRDRNAKLPAISQIYTAYQARCRQANAMDFDDLLMNTFRLFNDNADICRKYSERFQYILVDEYQDTNYAQVAIVKLLAAQHQRVCVVGDDYQSIYSFRGANIDNILDYQNKFDNVRVFKLERNYRSTQKIVEAANSLMKHNARQIPKDVYSEESEGTKISYRPCYSDKEEAMVVVKEIAKLQRSQSFEYDSFAILYRTNAQSRSFEDELRKSLIPYKIYGGLSFYQRKEIKDIIAYFRLVANPNDEEAFKRIINYPVRGIGNTTLQKIIDCANTNQVSLWDVVGKAQYYHLDVNKGTMVKLLAFVELINDFIRDLAMSDAFTLGSKIIKESGISTDLAQGTAPEDVSRRENLEELLAGIQAFVEDRREEGREDETFLTDFLQEVALYSDLDKKDDDSPKVSLMTIHAAKGLEFPVVFVVGLEENIFPNAMAANSRREIEEERRLLYVAITRAERFCFLTNAKNRYHFGTMQFNNPSRFLKDIDAAYLDTESGPISSLGGSRMPWDEPQRGGHWQNANPVASQFRADPKPKITAYKQPERAVDPLSERTKERLIREGGNFKRLSAAISNGGRQYATPTPSVTSSTTTANGLTVGATIEHQRFGIGVVEAIEGTGENAKATVAFRNAGTKQLLLKFAKFKVL
ncbi:ATP-dependent helicase [Prevotella aurantiaca]|jgi:putative ATP-dependent helicase pcrA|uniref:DNA 3'-5' helicase n=1 Tax=Prevotella aurantiaca TaxID=596085 RepID=A0A930HKG3_9BACT|nr:UvrD-helicase domain-containing protein [Prevotella aurantiaca]MBF1383449.1 UvrD-helicase domain-containing protein [Prevotella aurantiaca]